MTALNDAMVEAAAEKLKQMLIPSTARQLAREALTAALAIQPEAERAHINPNDVGKVASALGFFASCIKSGEAWTEHCEDALRQALDALTKITSRPLPAPPPTKGWTTMEHRLVNGALKRTDTGILARCECGWASGGHFSSLAASAAFMEHQESVAAPSPAEGGQKA